jgi:hypothetical protein
MLGTLVVVGLVWAGCPGSGPEGAKCVSGLLAGDLAISEIMANPAGKDEGKEWFEIYNPTAASIDLAGLRLESAREDGTGDASHVMRSINIAPGQYLVLGGMLTEVQPIWVDYAYASDLGGLRNSGGRLSLYCGQALVDRVVYGEAGEGVSLIQDGSLLPDAIVNDNLQSWCDSRAEYEPDSLGTPGTANELCESDIPPTQCREGEAVRDVVGPQPGDLVITEFMPNPQAVADETGEWFEVYVGRSLDLNGLRFGRAMESLEQVTSLECLPATAGSYVVLARSADPVANGQLPRVDWTFRFTMGNTSGQIYLAYADRVLDAVSYASSYTGASTSLEPTLTDPDQNDNPDYWCEAVAAYGAGDLGTPGAANASCGISPAGKCYDNGQLRDLRPPAAGDLVITEFMANPNKVADTDGEWFELIATRDVDLNGLELGRTFPTVDMRLPMGDCLPAGPGTPVLFARKADPAVNGGLPQVDHVVSFSLTNSGGGLFVGTGGVLLDQINWGSTGDGESTSLDAAQLDPVANDDPLNWCRGVSPYGLGDLGTPRAANPSCQ